MSLHSFNLGWWLAVFDSKHVKFMKDAEAPFGQEVDDAFPKAAEEISVAAKCIALQRNTACVFRLMKAMELAVARVAETIGTGKSTDKAWGIILADIGTTIAGLPRGLTRDQWSRSHSHRCHVKQAWWNDTIYPKKTYTVEQAQSVFMPFVRSWRI